MDRLEKIIINGEEYNIAGKDAYELAVDEGFEGTIPEWLESLKGVGISRMRIVEERDEHTVYAIDFTNGNHFEFTVKNGEDYVLTNTDITNIAEEAVSMIDIGEQILVPKASEPNEREGKDFIGLEVGKEYKAVYAEDPTLRECGYLAILFKDDDNWFNFFGVPDTPEDASNSFTFKVLGVENSVVSYEYNGVPATCDLSSHTHGLQNEIVDIGLKMWHGDLSLSVNIKGEKGDQGDTYELTHDDKEEIANLALDLMEQAEDFTYGD